MEPTRRLELALVQNLAGELILREARLFFGDEKEPHVRLVESGPVTDSASTFNWNRQKGLRAFVVLCLRSFAPGGQGFRLEGGSDSLAASLYEVVTASGENYLKLLLAIPKAQVKPSLKSSPEGYFDGAGNTHEPRYWVSLGPAFLGFVLQVVVETRSGLSAQSSSQGADRMWESGVIVTSAQPEDFVKLADMLDPLCGELLLEVRKNGRKE